LGNGAARADVAVPLHDYAARLKSADNLRSSPRWSDVAAHPEAYRGKLLGYELQVSGRIESATDCRLFGRDVAGELLTVVCPGGCRIGYPADWVGVIATIPNQGTPDEMIAGMVSRIAAPARPAESRGADSTSSTSQNGADTATPGGDSESEPVRSPASAAARFPATDAPATPVAPAPAPAMPAAPPPPPAAATESRFAPPYDTVKPQHLAILEQFIASRSSRLNAAWRRYVAAEVIRVANATGLRWEFFAALICAESDFDPTSTSGSGAMGLGQLMPGTADMLGVSHPYDVHTNLEGSAAYIRGHLDRFRDRNPNQQVELALASYNAGPNAVDRFGGVPPYAETINYIRKIESLYLQLCDLTKSAR